MFSVNEGEDLSLDVVVAGVKNPLLNPDSRLGGDISRASRIRAAVKLEREGLEQEGLVREGFEPP